MAPAMKTLSVLLTGFALSTSALAAAPCSQVRDVHFASGLSIMTDAVSLNLLNLEDALAARVKVSRGPWCMMFGRQEQVLIEGAVMRDAATAIQKELEYRVLRTADEHRKIYWDFCAERVSPKLGRVPTPADLYSDLKALKAELIEIRKAFDSAECDASK